MLNLLQGVIEATRLSYDYAIEFFDWCDDNLNDLYWWLEELK